jgi:hypothetical protein
MDTYDPLIAPDAEAWLELDEGERILLAEDFHRKARIKLPNRKIHAAIHAIIENQCADEKLPVKKTLDRLMAEGLDRHEAIHAIGSIMSGILFGIMKNKATEDPNPGYYKKLAELTAEQWRQSGQEDDAE